MAEKKYTKTNKILNRIIYCQIAVIGLYILSLLTLLIEFNDSQRREILRYIGNDQINDFTIEECIEHFGEPLIVEENKAMLFRGGSSKRIGLGCEYYEYELWVYLDESGQYVDYVSYRQIMERIIW